MRHRDFSQALVKRALAPGSVLSIVVGCDVSNTNLVTGPGLGSSLAMILNWGGS